MNIPKEKQDEIRGKIQKALDKKGRKGMECPVCSNNEFILIDGYVVNALQDNLDSGIKIGGPSIPSVVAACNNCGNMLFFNAIVLGLMGENNAKGQ